MSLISLIEEIPRYFTLDEFLELHKKLRREGVASVPIPLPPVLLLKVQHVCVKLKPSLSGLSSAELSQGTVYFMDEEFVFATEAGRGFRAEYKHIKHYLGSTFPGGSWCCALVKDFQRSRESNNVEGTQETALSSNILVQITPEDVSDVEDIMRHIIRMVKNFDRFGENDTEEVSENAHGGGEGQDSPKDASESQVEDTNAHSIVGVGTLRLRLRSRFVQLRGLFKLKK